MLYTIPNNGGFYIGILFYLISQFAHFSKPLTFKESLTCFCLHPFQFWNDLIGCDVEQHNALFQFINTPRYSRGRITQQLIEQRGSHPLHIIFSIPIFTATTFTGNVCRKKKILYLGITVLQNTCISILCNVFWSIFIYIKCFLQLEFFFEFLANIFT